MYLSPMEIRFTQSSISEQFRDGSLMMELFQDLVTGNEHPDSIDDIKCVRWKKKYWAIDGNRRLLLYKVSPFVYRLLNDVNILNIGFEEVAY